MSEVYHALENNTLPCKRCTKCSIEKPLTEFHKDKYMKDQRRPCCKSCAHQKSLEDKEKVKQRYIPPVPFPRTAILVRTCNVCKAEKPVEAFYRNGSYTDGTRISEYHGRCKTCTAEVKKNPLLAVVQQPLFVMSKVCNKCTKEKPLEEFNLNKDGKHGRTSHCKECIRDWHSKKWTDTHDRPEPLPIPVNGGKFCRNCLKEKPLSQFFRQQHTSDGLDYHCKECVHYKMYVVDRERTLARIRSTSEKNREKYKITQNRYRLDNPIKMREKSHRRRARVKKATVEQVNFQRILERDGMWCHICETPITPEQEMHFDHVIPLSPHAKATYPPGTHSEDNIRPAHGICNERKVNRLVSEMTPHQRRGPDC